MRQKFRQPLNPSLKRNLLARNRRAASGSPVRPLVVTASADADAVAVVDAGAVDVVASKPSLRRSLPLPRRALSPTCLGRKKQCRKTERPKNERWKQLNPKLRPRRKRPAFRPPFQPQRRVRRRASSFLRLGCPGSGKSSWFKRHNVVPLSSDMIRSLLFDDVREQRFQDLVFSNLRSMLKARLIAKRPMNYVDATNLTPQERQHWIKLAKDYNYEVHAVFFDVPLEVCVERHQRRDRVVPEDIMRRMAAKLKAPAFDEGFAKITVVRVKKKE